MAVYKRGIVLILGFILSLTLISAAYYGGSGFPTSIGQFFDQVAPSTMVLGVLFVVLFVLINFSLRRFFKQQPQIAGVVAAAISLLATYGIYRSGFDYENLFYNLIYFVGIPKTVIYTFLPFLLIGALIFIGVWLKNFGTSFLLMGILLIGVSLVPELVYARGTVFIIGLVLFIIGIVLLYKRHQRTGYRVWG